ncbi:uncharacterized protein LOC125861258 [Solanum stenotomum]|uniref:uncharacterized protein LOC125861258 n=1 Tax=Solanum stenotomum TaxID=172797 RepID=UPI0020D148C9|nr:uncharacterized protein LOC125861258 [Solanum stenotomum]
MPFTKFLQINSILIYDNPREIAIPPSHDIEIFIAPILGDESIIRKLMLCRPRIMSILPCTNSEVLEVLSALKRCTQKQNCGKECPFNTELFYNHHKLKEVIRCAGVTIEKGRASKWYSWLKSTSLIDQVTSFMLTWEVLAVHLGAVMVTRFIPAHHFDDDK